MFKEAMLARGHARIVESTPARRIGTPDDIVELTCFLLSDAAGFITGQTCVAAGGLVTLPRRLRWARRVDVRDSLAKAVIGVRNASACRRPRP